MSAPRAWVVGVCEQSLLLVGCSVGCPLVWRVELFDNVCVCGGGCAHMRAECSGCGGRCEWVYEPFGCGGVCGSEALRLLVCAYALMLGDRVCVCVCGCEAL